MGFQNVITVKKPRKKYKCDICHKEIKSAHIKRSGLHDGDFFSVREHIECYEIMNDICSKCEFRLDCEFNPAECYNEFLQGKGGNDD